MTDIGARMTVVKLSGGGLVRLDEGNRTALDELGPVRFVVAPSRVHHLRRCDLSRGSRISIVDDSSDASRRIESPADVFRVALARRPW
jgi:hypothetical protein